MTILRRQRQRQADACTGVFIDSCREPGRNQVANLRNFHIHGRLAQDSHWRMRTRQCFMALTMCFSTRLRKYPGARRSAGATGHRACAAEAVAARPAKFTQGLLHQGQALVELHALGRCRAVPAFIVVEHFERLGLTHLVPSVMVDHQIHGRAIKECTRMLDPLTLRAFQHPDIGIVGHVFGRLAIAKPGRQETHQFAIVMFHDGTWRLLLERW